MGEQRKRETRRFGVASLVSGSLTGAIVSVGVQPFDVIRTKLQGDVAKGLHRDTYGTVQAIFREGGLRAFWRGLGPTVIRLSMGLGVHFLTLDALRGLLEDKHEARNSSLSALKTALVGGVARGTAVVLLCPVTVVKTRMEYGPTAYKSTVGAIASIARTERFSGLFKGLVPTLVSQVPFSALHYMIYRWLQSHLQDSSQPRVAVNFFSSGMAAAGATLLTQPADVTRTRMQLGMGAGGRFAAFSTLQQLVAAEGMRGMMTGTGPRILKRILQSGITWALYEELAPYLSSLGEASRGA